MEWLGFGGLGAWQTRRLTTALPVCGRLPGTVELRRCFDEAGIQRAGAFGAAVGFGSAEVVAAGGAGDISLGEEGADAAGFSVAALVQPLAGLLHH